MPSVLLAAVDDDRVGDIAVDHRIVHAGDGDGLGHVPVGAVKVSEAGQTVPSVRSLLETAIVTSAVGWLVEHDREGGRAAGLGRCRR